MSVRGLFLVELQTYGQLLDWEISPLGAFSEILPGFWAHSFFLEQLLSSF